MDAKDVASRLGYDHPIEEIRFSCDDFDWKSIPELSKLKNLKVVVVSGATVVMIRGEKGEKEKATGNEN